MIFISNTSVFVRLIGEDIKFKFDFLNDQFFYFMPTAKVYANVNYQNLMLFLPPYCDLAANG